MATTTLETPLDLIHFKLRVAITMEEDSLASLGELAKAAKSSEVKHLFTHHSEETSEQLEHLHEVAKLMEFRETGAANPVSKGIQKHAASLIEKTSGALRDQVTLGAALGNEHFEIASYQGLIVPLTALGATEAVALLQANLEQEEHTSEELRDMLEKIVAA